jgi:hypothetical protein
VSARCPDGDAPCTKNVGQEVTVGWKIASSLTPDRIDLTLNGTTIEGWDVGAEFWTSQIPPKRDHPSLFQPANPTRSLPEPATAYTDMMTCASEADRCRGARAKETFFWQDPGTFDVTLTLKKDEGGGTFSDLGSCKKTFTVERNTTDPERQPLVFFLSPRSAHPEESAGPADVHAKWHAARDQNPRFPAFPGEDWIFFHRALVAGYDGWRAFFGYPPVTPWDASTNLPTSDGSYPMGHPTRPGTEGTLVTCDGYASGCEPGPWFTAGGDPLRGRPDDLPTGRVCKTYLLQTIQPGQVKLADFVDDRALGCVMNSTHHRLLHDAIRGVFPFIATTPHDPIFWAYHKYVSGPPFAIGGLGTPVPRAIPSEGSLFAAFEAVLAEGPPGVTGVFPTRDEVLAYLPTIVVEFWEPVTGVAAGDLTVNGSPATNLQAHSPSSYIFWGFADPGTSSTLVPVTVALAAGAIQDGGGNPFPGTTWSYTVDVDQDGDGIPDVRDNCPSAPNTGQANSSQYTLHGAHYGDTHDPSLPLGRPGHPEGDACHPDDDGDGIDDATEQANGTDPTNYYDPYVCPFDEPPKVEPGPCGCGWLDTLDGNGSCVLAIKCSTLACDDGDACTLDGCTPSQGCVRSDGEGTARVTCLCDRAPSAACAGQTLPDGITKKLAAACRLVTKAVDASKAKKRKRFVKAASRKYAAAARVAKKAGKKGKLSTECVAGERGLFDDAKARLRTLLDPG